MSFIAKEHLNWENVSIFFTNSILFQVHYSFNGMLTVGVVFFLTLFHINVTIIIVIDILSLSIRSVWTTAKWKNKQHAHSLHLKDTGVDGMSLKFCLKCPQHNQFACFTIYMKLDLRVHPQETWCWVECLPSLRNDLQRKKCDPFSHKKSLTLTVLRRFLHSLYAVGIKIPIILCFKEVIALDMYRFICHGYINIQSRFL